MNGIVGVEELIGAWVVLLKVGKKVDILRLRKRRIERDGFERNERGSTRKSIACLFFFFHLCFCVSTF